jgi:hypothetical protein
MDRYICLEDIQPAEVLRQLELITFA